MRHLVACILFAANAITVHAGPEEARVRALVDNYRSEESRRVWDTTFEGTGAIEVDAFTAEYTWDVWWKCSYALVHFVPKTDSVEIQCIVLNSIPPDGPTWIPDGCTVKVTSISRIEYVSLLTGFALISRAALTPRAERGAPPPPNQAPVHRPVGELQLRVGPLWEGSGVYTPDLWVENGLIEPSIDARARTLLASQLLEERLGTYKFVELASTPASVLAMLREGFSSTRGWRRDLRAALLGWLGDRSDLPMLDATFPRTLPIDRARLQLEVVEDALRSRVGLARLLDLADERDPGLRAWARTVIRAKFATPYKTKLAKEFRAARDDYSRQQLLKEYNLVDPSDEELHREALSHPSVRIRVMAADRLKAWDVLVAIAKDTSRRSGDEFQARVRAIQLLGYGPLEARRDLGRAVTEILRDKRDDVRARGAAAEAIGRAGLRAGVPAILEALEEPAPARPVVLEDGRVIEPAEYEWCCDIRFGLVRAVGLLRVREGMRRLLEILRSGLNSERMEEGGLASVAGEALARIGDPDAKGELESALERANADAKDCWARRLSLLDSIVAGNGAGILRAFDHGRDNIYVSGCFAPCDRYWVDLLVEVVPADELKRLATTEDGMADANSRLLRAAIAKVTRR